MLHFSYPVDHAALDAAAEALFGERDLRAFTLSDEPYHSYRRRIARAEWIQRDRLL